MDDEKKQRAVARWKLENGFSECDSPNSYTRKQIMAMLIRKDEIRQKLAKGYCEIFGEGYHGDILEDVVLDLNLRRKLEKMVGQK